MRVESVLSSAIDIIDGHRCVDLGLSVNWADSNVGALRSNEAGDKYGWGIKFSTNDTIPKEIKNISGTKYDIVSQLWGDKWRIPTKSEFSELVHTCIVYDDTEQNVEGKRFIGPNGNTIFIPYTEKNNLRHNSSWTVENSTEFWTGSREKTSQLWHTPYMLQVGSISGCNILSLGSEKNEKYFRPVVNKINQMSEKVYWGNPKNDLYLIKGQVVKSWDGNMPYSSAINIYDNKTGKLLQQIINEKGLFEMWVDKNQELRFEVDDNDSQYKPTIMKVSPIMKIEMSIKPSFGLAK